MQVAEKTNVSKMLEILYFGYSNRLTQNKVNIFYQIKVYRVLQQNIVSANEFIDSI